ncbi:MAG: hypothetical protein FWD66_01030 [Paludibacter sp.]|nr:hypothetical protein [Paludibacter sp.]
MITNITFCSKSNCTKNCTRNLNFISKEDRRWVRIIDFWECQDFRKKKGNKNI